MYPRCVASILSWRAVLVLTVLATVLQATSIVLSWRVNEAERNKQYRTSPHKKELLPYHQKNEISNSQLELYTAWLAQQAQFHPLHEQGTFNHVISSTGVYSTRLKDYDLGVQNDNHNRHVGDKSLPSELSATLSRLARQSVVDISGQYRVATAFLMPSGSGSRGSVGRRVTLATQGSAQHLHRVMAMAHQWQGPMSVSVFALSHEVQWLVQTLLQLRRCHTSVAANVSFSIVTPAAVAPVVLRREVVQGLPLAVLAPLSERRLHSHRGEELRALLDAWSGPDSGRREGNERRKVQSRDVSFKDLEYSMKYSRRKLKNYVINAKYASQKNFSDILVNNVDSHLNDKLSVANNNQKYRKQFGANFFANYRYVSNSKQAPRIIRPSPDSTPCAKVPDLSSLSPHLVGPPNNVSRVVADHNYDLPGVQYPNNLLRNAAVQAAKSPFVLVLDIDMMPSEGLHQQFVDFASKRKLMRRFAFKFRHESYTDDTDGQSYAATNVDAATAAPAPPPYGLDNVSFTPEEKVAFVLPAYEIMEDMAFPRTKEQLLRLINTGQARPFYDKLCRKCQRPTNYSAWEALQPPPLTSVASPLVAAYEVLWRDPWEPFYITATDTMPRYDERFRQYGFNRISQVCEAHVSGHRFVVLSPGFVVHRGLKVKGLDRAAKDEEQQRNRMLFRQFKQELKLRYPLSNKRCY